MSSIICAIRGGPASHSTIRKAIELALATQQPLYFLYIVDVGFLKRTPYSRTAAIIDEMQQMGEMILLLAQEMAAGAGVRANTMVLQGQVDAQIVMLCQELDADTVVLGEPLRALGATVFTTDQLQELSARLQSDCDAEVVVER